MPSDRREGPGRHSWTNFSGRKLAIALFISVFFLKEKARDSPVPRVDGGTFDASEANRLCILKSGVVFLCPDNSRLTRD